MIHNELSQPPKGYPRWHLFVDHLPEIIPKCICQLCEQFTQRPVRCSRCDWTYCKDCQSYLNQLQSILKLEKSSNLREFFCFNKCIDTCNDEYPTMALINELLHQQYPKFLFDCRHIFCKFDGKPDEVFSHELDCVAGTFDWSFHTSMMISNYWETFMTNVARIIL